MTTHDTAAALEAAIDKYTQAAIANAGALGAPDEHVALSAAWCAVALEVENHVDAEIARRLAVAPTVESAIGALMSTAMTEGGVHVTERDINRIDDRRTALRAAIAADKARAVEAAGRVDVRLLHDALRYVTAWGHVPGGTEDWKARNQDRVEDELRAAIQRGLNEAARPTPDEARRLVDRYDQATRNSHLTGGPEALWSARTALLRALGVEA